MGNIYNREMLLHEAMIERETDLQELAEKLEMTENEVVEGLTGPDQLNHITKVSEALGIDHAFFWGGMKFENGKLMNA